MSELWAIAMGERIVNGTNADNIRDAWHRFYIAVDEDDMTVDDFTETQKRRGYSAVRLRYEIIERDGEVR